MTDFDFDVKQKKSIAHGAYARKSGSKSKKCTLPSDSLTEAQKRKLNGPCVGVKLDEPMSWEQFKSLPLSLAKEYIANLRETYNASQLMLSGMFGVSPPLICRTFKAMGIESGPAKRTDFGEATKVKQAKWDAFCHGVVGGGSNLIIGGANDKDEAGNDEIEVLDTSDLPPLTAAELAEEMSQYEPDAAWTRAEAPKPAPARATDLSATFEGFPNLATLEQFYRLIGTDKVRVHIRIEVVE